MNCPLCSKPNHCGMASGNGDCWCFQLHIPEDLLKQVPEAEKGKVCICKRCVEAALADANDQ